MFVDARSAVNFETPAVKQRQHHRMSPEEIGIVSTCIRSVEADEIIISAMEHHANIVSWRMLGEEKGARCMLSAAFIKLYTTTLRRYPS